MKSSAPPKSAIIIGAGVGGLALANLLAKSGIKVDVFEKQVQPGGRAGQLKIDGFTFDTGPSWYLMPEIFEKYFSLIGEDIHNHLDLIRLEPGYKITFSNGKTLNIHGNNEDKQTFESIEKGAGVELQKYLDRAEYIYKIATKHFLYTNFDNSKNLISKEIIKAGTGMLAMGGKTMDANLKSYFKDESLRQILEYPAVFLGASPFKAPAIYSLMSHMDFKQGVFYPQGGIYRLIEALVAIGKTAGVTYHYNASVSRIITNNGQAAGIELQDDRRINSDIVISNADLHFTETKLLPKKLQTYPEIYWQKRTAGPSAILMYLGVKGSLPEFEHHNLFFTDNWQSSFEDIFDKKIWPEKASMYVCKSSQTDASVAPKGHENVFVLVPGPAAAEMSREELDKLAGKYLDQLIKNSGVKDLKTRIVTKKVFGPADFASQLNAWQGTALGLSHTLKQSAMLRPKNKSRKVKNLYYVGANTVPGIGLPMCLIGAELVYKRIIGDKTSSALHQLKDMGKI